MAAVNFDRALALTLKFEGCYVDNSADPGGATNMGVTRATLSRVRSRPVAKSEIAALTRAEAAAIYRKLYWDAVSGDVLPAGIDMVLFDHAVNSGPGAALRTLRAVLDLPADARLADPATLTRIQNHSPSELVRQLCAARRTFLSRLKTFAKFGAGWMSRVSRLEREALELVAGPETHSQPALMRPSKEKPMPSNSSAARPSLDAKPFWASQTIWSSLAVIGSSATGAMLAWTANDMAGFGASLTALLGGVNAVVGRFRATGPIG